jgi:hypothetical protein
LASIASAAAASDLEDLAKDGYAVIEEAQVDGKFEGCDFDRRIKLTNGLVFVCQTYSYSYAYNPDVLILKHIRTGDIKFLIDGEEYDGSLYRTR